MYSRTLRWIGAQRDIGRNTGQLWRLGVGDSHVETMLLTISIHIEGGDGDLGGSHAKVIPGLVTAAHRIDGTVIGDACLYPGNHCSTIIRVISDVDGCRCAGELWQLIIGYRD